MNPSFGPVRLLAQMAEAAQAAGALALGFFEPGQKTRARIEYKDGGSPVTEADYAADRLIEPLLRRALPEAAFVSEERKDESDRLSRRAVFIVDPIDGTRAFMRGDPRWAVSIALVVDRQPCLGVLTLPALGKTYAAARGRGSTLNGEPIRVSDRTQLAGARVAGAASIAARLRQAGLEINEEPRVPSLAYRIAKVGAGEIDVGLASTDAYDWDIAAADLVLREAGGSLCDMNGEAPIYNGASLRHGALIAAPTRLTPIVIEALRTSEARR